MPTKNTRNVTVQSTVVYRHCLVVFLVGQNVQQVELLIIHRVFDLEVSYRSDEVWIEYFDKEGLPKCGHFGCLNSVKMYARIDIPYWVHDDWCVINV